MKKKEDLRITKTKASLYRGLMELMREHPFEEIKVSEICSISLINRSTFYDHFNDKYELLEALINDMKKDLIESLIIDKTITTIKDYFLEAMVLILNHIEKNKDLYSSIVKINSNSIARDMINDVLLNSVISEFNDHVINHSNIPTRSLILFYASGVANIINDSLLEPNTFDKSKIYSILDSLIPNLDFIEYKK